jgi:sec-independent protein translocase protein TatB
MGMSEILLILVIVLILFGPEDLPGIARTIGKVAFQIRQATNELAKEFQKSNLDNPVNMINKAFEQTTSSHVTLTQNEQSGTDDRKTDDELLTHEDEIPASEVPSKTKSEDPLAEPPTDMVSYEEKGASR